jgi:hypothetical protein
MTNPQRSLQAIVRDSVLARAHNFRQASWGPSPHSRSPIDPALPVWESDAEKP